MEPGGFIWKNRSPKVLFGSFCPKRLNKRLFSSLCISCEIKKNRLFCWTIETAYVWFLLMIDRRMIWLLFNLPLHGMVLDWTLVDPLGVLLPCICLWIKWWFKNKGAMVRIVKKQVCLFLVLIQIVLPLFFMTKNPNGIFVSESCGVFV